MHLFVQEEQETFQILYITVKIPFCHSKLIWGHGKYCHVLEETSTVARVSTISEVGWCLGRWNKPQKEEAGVGEAALAAIKSVRNPCLSKKPYWLQDSARKKKKKR